MNVAVKRLLWNEKTGILSLRQNRWLRKDDGYWKQKTIYKGMT